MIENKNKEPEYEGTNSEIAWYLLRKFKEQDLVCDMLLDIGNSVNVKYKNKEGYKLAFDIEIRCFHYDGRVTVDDIIKHRTDTVTNIIAIAVDNYYTEQAKYYADLKNILLLDKDDLDYLGSKSGGKATIVKMEKFIDKWSKGN